MRIADVELPIFEQQFKSNPYPFYSMLRSVGKSVTYVRLPTGGEVWLVTGYAEARKLLNDPRLSNNPCHANPKSHPSHLNNNDDAAYFVVPYLVTMDPPDHTRVRTLVAREFSPQRIKRLRPHIEDIAAELLDKIAPLGKADLIEEFALPLPLRVICEILGVPIADQPLFRRWVALLVAAKLEQQSSIPIAAGELYEYMQVLIDAKRRQHDDSLLCALVAAQADGSLAEEELVAMGFLLLIAGHETSANFIGNGVFALLNHRAEWAKLCEQRNLVRSAVEELLRFDSPFEMTTARFATSEIRINDAQIRPGDTVFIALPACNRDPNHFDKADQLGYRARHIGSPPRLWPWHPLLSRGCAGSSCGGNRPGRAGESFSGYGTGRGAGSAGLAAWITHQRVASASGTIPITISPWLIVNEYIGIRLALQR